MSSVVAAALLVLAPVGWADDAPQAPDEQKPQKIVAVVGGTVLTMAGAPIESGSVIIADGKIQAVGADVSVPDGAERIDATGKTVMPGLIDAASRLYVDQQSPRGNGPGGPELRVTDGVDTFTDDGLEVLKYGVTCVHALPGTLGEIDGLSAVIKVGAGDGSLDAVADAVAVVGEIGVPSGDATSSLAKLSSYTSIREALLAARDYQFGWGKYERELSEYDRNTAKSDEKETADKPPDQKPPGDKPERPKKPGADPGKDVLVKVLDGEISFVIEAHRVPDILNALRIRDEFGVNLIILGCSEGHRIAPEIARRGVPVIVSPVSLSVVSPSRVLYGDHSRANAAILAAAGVRVAIGVGGDSPLHSKLVRTSAAIAVAHGLDRQAALEAITIRAAEMLGVGERVGSLVEGHDGDLVILSGDPLDVRTPIDAVLVDGEVVYERGAGA